HAGEPAVRVDRDDVDRAQHAGSVHWSGGSADWSGSGLGGGNGGAGGGGSSRLADAAERVCPMGRAADRYGAGGCDVRLSARAVSDGPAGDLGTEPACDGDWRGPAGSGCYALDWRAGDHAGAATDPASARPA